MTRILAIAFLQMRAAIRSRLFASLMAVLVLTVLGLPLTIKGDGTLAGQIKIILYYTLGLSTIILGVATLWASSGAIAQEVESKQIQLVVVKPVRAFEIWLGKWLGLLAMNAVLLFTVGLIVYFLVQWNIRSADTAGRELGVVREELLAGRRLILPRDTLEEEVMERYHAMMNRGMIATNFSREEALSFIRKDLLTEKTVVGSGAVKQWILDVPDFLREAGGEDRPVTLNICFSPVRKGNNTVHGEWRIGTERNPVLFNMATNVSMDGTYKFTVPITRSLIDKIMEGTATGDSHGRTMIVEYRNGSGTDSRTVVFDRKQGIILFIRESGFESNLVRAILVVLCRLALLAAIGLTASTLFSFPVTTFTTFSLLLLPLIIHYYVFLLATDTGSCCAEHQSGIEKESISHKIVERVVKKVDSVVLGPVMKEDPVDRLSEGALVSWGDTAKAVLLVALLYPFLLGLAGVLLFRLRELALPSS